MKMLFDAGDYPGGITTDLTQLSCSLCLLHQDTLLLLQKHLQFLLVDSLVQGSTHLHGVLANHVMLRSLVATFVVQLTRQGTSVNRHKMSLECRRGRRGRGCV